MPYEKFSVLDNTDETLKSWKRKLEYLFNKNLDSDNVATTNLTLGLAQVKANNIDFGTGANQVDASDIPIIDNSSYFVGTNVELALQQLGSTIINPTVDTLTFSTNIVTASTIQGTMFWDNQDETLSVVMAGGNVIQQVGQELYIRAVNKTGSIITNGSIVYISGAQGNRPTISLANANSYANSQKVIGLATEDIGINAYGYVTIEGLVRDLDTSTHSDGDYLYLSTNSGQWSTTPPSDGLARIKIGVVTKSHGTDGWVCVKVQEDKYMFGAPDGGNYSYFSSNGSLNSVGVGLINEVTYKRKVKTTTTSTELTSTNSGLVIAGGTITLTLPSIPMAQGIWYDIVNNSTGIVTLDGNTTDLIYDALTFQLYEGESIKIIASSSAWFVG